MRYHKAEARIMGRWHGVGEPIYAMANIYVSREKSITLQIHVASTRVGNPYFKAFDSDSFTKARRVARISMRKPEYIIHKDRAGKQPWTLNAQEKATLLEILALPNSYAGNFHGTTWQCLVVAYNMEKFGMSLEEVQSIKYAEWKKREKDTTYKYRNCVAFDAPMPNYEDL